MRKIFAAFAAIALLWGACSDDDSAGDLDTTTTVGLGAPDLEAKLLEVGDLPDGYEFAGAGSSISGEDGDPTGCAQLDDGEEGRPAAGEDARVGFRKGEFETGATFVTESIERFLTPEDAKAAFDSAVTGFTACSTFTATSDDGAVTSGTMSPQSFPQLRDGSFAMLLRMNVAVEGETVRSEGHVIGVRAGRLLMVVSSITGDGTATPLSQLEPLVRKAADKL